MSHATSASPTEADQPIPLDTATTLSALSNDADTARNIVSSSSSSSSNVDRQGVKRESDMPALSAAYPVASRSAPPSRSAATGSEMADQHIAKRPRSSAVDAGSIASTANRPEATVNSAVVSASLRPGVHGPSATLAPLSSRTATTTPPNIPFPLPMKVLEMLQESAQQACTCHICRDIMTEPSKLPCDHTFCHSCLSRLISPRYITCPMCSRQHDPASIRSDARMAERIENLQLMQQQLWQPGMQLPSTTVGQYGTLPSALLEPKQRAPSEQQQRDQRRQRHANRLVCKTLQSMRTSLHEKLEETRRQMVLVDDHLQQAMADLRLHHVQHANTATTVDLVPSLDRLLMLEGDLMHDEWVDDTRSSHSTSNMYIHEPDLMTNWTDSFAPQSSSTSAAAAAASSPVSINSARVGTKQQMQRVQQLESMLPELGSLYLDRLHKCQKVTEHGALGTLTAAADALSRYCTLQVVGRVRYGDPAHTAAIVSSVEFNVDDSVVALAGVTRKIKLYELSSYWQWLRQHQLDQQHDSSLLTKSAPVPRLQPKREITGPNRISCVSWNHFEKGQLASADYAGVITVLDTEVGRPVAAYQEHECRAWSVDYSAQDPRIFASGSDDAKVKLWSVNHETSVHTIHSQANVCTVRFSPGNRHLLTFGSADHNAYCYDLRFPSRPIYTCTGHQKAISCIRHLDADTFVTASTDGTLRAWSYAEQGRCVREYSGHVNSKNFVGLSISQDGRWISCGSEDNQVYTYYVDLAKPLIVTPFHTASPVTGQDVTTPDATLFVSALSWCRHRSTMIAGNSFGEVKLLSLEDAL